MVIIILIKIYPQYKRDGSVKHVKHFSLSEGEKLNWFKLVWQQTFLIHQQLCKYLNKDIFLAAF